MNTLSDMQYGDDGVVYTPYILVQASSEEDLDKLQKALNSLGEKFSKKECHTKYKTDVSENTQKCNDDVKSDYIALTVDEYKVLGRMRIDEFQDAEWQCPTCKHRVKNLQQEMTKDGNPCWGCQKFCDTLDASYFNGKACKLYEEGDSNIFWP